jgi:anti-sigma B factor antagonist
MVTPGRLEIADHVQADRHTLVLDGDLTVANAQELEETIARLCVDGVEAITIDLGRLRFIDTTGLKVVVWAQARCREHGYEFLLMEGSAAVQRVFELTGLRNQLPFVDRGGV